MRNIPGSLRSIAVMTACLWVIGATSSRAQEIEIYSSTDVSIPDGETQTSVIAHSYIGDLDVNNVSSSWYFQIYNRAPNSTLTFGGNASISGTHAGDFTATHAIAPLQNVGNSTTANCALEVNFNPSGVGLRTAIVTVTSNDANEGVYTFAVAGKGTTGLQNAPSDTQITAYKEPKAKFNSKLNLTQVKGKFQISNNGPSPSDGAIVRIYVVAGDYLPMSTLLGVPAQSITIKPTKALSDPALDKEKRVSFKATIPGNVTTGRVFATINPLPGTLTEDYWLDNISNMNFFPTP